MAATSQRRALSAHRRRTAAKGLVRVEVQTPRGDAVLIRALAERLRGGPEAASAARAALRRALGPDAASALDLFGSDLPDEAFEGVFDHPRGGGWRALHL